MQETNELDKIHRELKWLSESRAYNPTAQQISALAEELLKYGPEKVRTAVREHFRIGKFWPAPVELINLIETGNLKGEKPERVRPAYVTPMRLIPPNLDVPKERTMEKIWADIEMDPKNHRSLWRGTRFLKGTTAFTKQLKECVDEITDPEIAKEWEREMKTEDREINGFSRFGGLLGDM